MMTTNAWAHVRKTIAALSVVAIGVGIFGSAAQAIADRLDTERRFEIPAQQLATALVQFSRQAEVQLVTSSVDLGTRETPGVFGHLSIRRALESLLDRTGLSYSLVGENTVAIVSPATSNHTSSFLLHGGEEVPQADEGIPSPSAGEDKKSFWQRLRLAQAEAPSNAEGENQRTSESSSESSQKRVELGEVIVTATKRQERAQDIPISIAVISNQDIERRGLIGMEDYLRSIPGVNQIDRGGFDNSIIIRGITSSPELENSSTGSGSTVATYFDETPITGAAGPGQGGIDLRPVDMERIEVLRGPQGTAYGASSLGGTLRLIPAKPRLDAYNAKLAADYSYTSDLGGENSIVQGVFNIPIARDQFALRAVGYHYSESGFYRNIAGNDPALLAVAGNFGLTSFVEGHLQDDVGRMRTTGGRLAALWQAGDKLDLTLNVLTQKIEQDGSPLATLNEFDQSRGPIAPQARVRGEAGEVNDTDIDLVNLVLNYDLGWATWTSVASWVDSGGAFTTGGQSLIPFLGPFTGAAHNDFNSDTAETRLTSHLSGRFQFLGGLFYERAKEHYLTTSDWPGTPATSPICTNPAFVCTTPMFIFNFHRKRDQRAVFGELSYALTPKLTATAGGRYFEYDKNHHSLAEGGLGGIPIGGGVPVDLQNDESDSIFKANLSYKPRESAVLYATWSQGFRLGRPQAVVSALCDNNPKDGLIDGTNVTVASTGTIDSDFLDNYELGAKLAFFDRRMTLDTAVYHIDWQGLPVRTIAGTCQYTANAGAATSDGVEFQASLFAVRGLRLDFGAGYNQSELSKDAPALGAQKGDRLPGSPKVTANLAAQYDFDLAGHSAFVRADSFYTGKFYGDLQQNPGTAAGDYIKVDARAGMVFRDLSVELFVRNVTNKDDFTWRGISGFNTGATNPFFGYRLRPRTLGIQLAYDFK